MPRAVATDVSDEASSFFVARVLVLVILESLVGEPPSYTKILA